MDVERLISTVDRATRTLAGTSEGKGNMATIKRKFLGERTIAGGATDTFIWNNPPRGTVLGYFAYANPDVPEPGGSNTGEVGIVSVRHQATVTNSDTSDRVEIDVKNFRSTPTKYALYESWITGT
jgi:hypothetical protein